MLVLEWLLCFDKSPQTSAKLQVEQLSPYSEKQNLMLIPRATTVLDFRGTTGALILTLRQCGM